MKGKKRVVGDFGLDVWSESRETLVEGEKENYLIIGKTWFGQLSREGVKIDRLYSDQQKSSKFLNTD